LSLDFIIGGLNEIVEGRGVWGFSPSGVARGSTPAGGNRGALPPVGK